MDRTDLRSFIAAAKERGAGDEFLAALLTRNGWPARDVYEALGQWWEAATGVPMPVRRSAGESAREAFFYLVAFSALATWASALGSLWFSLIERWLPDPLSSSVQNDFRSTVTWQMASILVALPVFLFVMRLIVRETRLNPDRLESDVRKWLTYIALFLAAVGVISDLVCFVDYFLGGELTLRFVLKCLIVLAICGGIFAYYLDFLRGTSRNAVFASLAIAAAAIGLGFGFTTAGAPNVQRQFEADARRVQDLRGIATAVSFVNSLPASLADLKARQPALRISDPVTGVQYGYAVKSPTEYELCAEFSASSETGGAHGPFWSHGQGRACFELERGRAAPW